MSARYRRLHERNMRLYLAVLYVGVGVVVAGVAAGLVLHDFAGLVVAVGSVVGGGLLAFGAFYIRRVTERIMTRFLERSGRQHPPPP